MNIHFKLNESKPEFCEQFYLEARSLTSNQILNDSDACIALQHALKPYYELGMAMMPAFLGKPSTQDMVNYLILLHTQFGGPKTGFSPLNRLKNKNSHGSNNSNNGNQNSSASTTNNTERKPAANCPPCFKCKNLATLHETAEATLMFAFPKTKNRKNTGQNRDRRTYLCPRKFS